MEMTKDMEIPRVMSLEAPIATAGHDFDGLFKTHAIYWLCVLAWLQKSKFSSRFIDLIVQLNHPRLENPCVI